MKQIEFYSYDDEVWYRNTDGHTEVLSENSREIIDLMYDTLKRDFKESFAALRSIYGISETNLPYYKYVMVKRFIKCNFSRVDTTYIDLESLGDVNVINLEKVDCPLRGECPYEGLICQPRISSNLTERELTVATYLYDGKRKDEIAKLMFLSVDTINNHIRRIYRKLNVHSEVEFAKYFGSMRNIKTQKYNRKES